MCVRYLTLHIYLSAERNSRFVYPCTKYWGVRVLFVLECHWPICACAHKTNAQAKPSEAGRVGRFWDLLQPCGECAAQGFVNQNVL